jgi:hypothetical protein
MNRICSSLEPDHSFVFVNGSVPTEPSPGLGDSKGPYLRFGPHEGDDLSVIPGIIEDLLSLAADEGPFDGVIGFSEGGAAAANMMIEDAKNDPRWCEFKCGIFFCALTPVDVTQVTDKVRHLSASEDGILITLPTAHIWSQGGDYHPGMGQDLVELCQADVREQVIHQLGHEVPGARSDDFYKETMRAIERTIERAKSL